MAEDGSVAFGESALKASDRPLSLPCGQCIGCRVRKSREWALRCMHEAQMHDRCSFVTLTYDDEHLPEDGSLHVEDWQRFAKRVRRGVGPFRYFAAGEYGDENLRPHWHACFFGLDWKDDAIELDENHWISPRLMERWGHGMVNVGSLTYESAAYVARYCMKKRTGKLSVEYRREVIDLETGEVKQNDVRPEFAMMSRRPGIGAGWFEKFSGDVYPEDAVTYGGRKFRPPRFYDSLLESEELESLKAKREVRAAQHAHDLTHERLESRERIADARLRGQRRDV